MTLVKFRHPNLESNFVNEVFDKFFQSELVNDNAYNSIPKANVIEMKEGYRIEMAIPGFDKESINMSIHKNILTVKGEREEAGKENEKYVSREYSSNKFLRRFNLPKSINTELISGKVENGILSVTLPKREESIDKGPQNIAIS